MAALTEFAPIRAETVDTIRARIDANVNAGLDPADGRWQDTVPGSFFYDHTQAFALELEGVYDYVSLELPASFFLPFSWGIYLDYWGEMLDVPRNQPVAASGEVTLTNVTAAAILAAAGLEVAVPASSTDIDPLTYNTTATVNVPAGGSVDISVIAGADGEVYNVAATAISQVTSPVSGLTVANAAAITGGADEELDEPYKARLLLEFTGARGAGTIDDYVAETLAEFPQVGNVVVQAAWAGPNTVRLIISDHANQPLDGPTVVDLVEAYWATHAPIDADVTVATVAVKSVAVVADLEVEAGFTLDGDSGTTPIRATLDAALADYFHGLPAGRNVVHNRVLSVLLSVDGVYDVSTLTLDSGAGPVAGDVVINDLESAQLTGLGTYTAALPPST